LRAPISIRVAARCNRIAIAAISSGAAFTLC